MAQKIIPCGGWYIDENTLTFDENKVLSVTSGGGEAGVSSFNGRTGAVVPQDGDYTAEQVGALPISGGTMTGAIAMGSQKITGLADATDPGDALNKKVGDATYALKTAIPTNATTATAGIVKQATAIEDSSGATDTALETKFNALLAALRTAGVLASS